MWGSGLFLAGTDGADTPLFAELQLLGRELAAAGKSPSLLGAVLLPPGPP